MKYSIILPAMLCCMFMQAQIPYTINSSGNNSFSSGSTDIYANSIQVGNASYAISSSAQVSLRAGQYIYAEPGFKADAFTSGFAALVIDPKIMDVASFHPNGFSSIPKYSRFEAGIKLPAAIQQQIEGFLSNGIGINPYDPDQISIECKFTDQNQNIYARKGFYYADFSVANNNWVPAGTDYKFRVRFAPPKTGAYKCEVSLYLNNVLQQEYAKFTINVSNSSNPGHLLMANGNLRKMQFENGNMFFGVGQNIGYVFGNMGAHPDCMEWYCRPPSQYDQYRGWIDDLANNQGNFVRLRLDPFDFPIEWEEWQMLTSNPAPAKTLLQCLNNYDHNQKFMWEFDKVMDRCESRGVYIMLNLLLEASWSSVSRPGDAADFYWQDNPYSALLGNNLNGLKSFFTNSSAKSYYKKLLYYIQARWGYSTNLAIWELINETENLEDFKTDPNYAADVKNWVCEMKSHLETFYPWHPTTNGTIPNDESSAKQPNCLNIFSENSYNASVDKSDNCSYQNGNLEQRFPVQSDYHGNFKPFVFGELGAGEGTILSKIDKNMDREFHNAIWATTMMGGISCGLYWNDFEQAAGVNHRGNFNALRAFTNRIDWTEVYTTIGKHKDEGLCTSNGEKRKVFTFWQRNGARNIIFGWAMNGSSNWFSHGNEFVSAADFFSVFFSAFNPCFPFSNSYTVFDASCNPEMEVEDLLSSTLYEVQIFDPYDPGNQLLETQNNKLSSPTGTLRFRRELPANIGSPFFPDYAFIIKEADNNRLAAEDAPAAGSLQHYSDKISLFPNPAKNAVTLSYESKETLPATVEIKDMLGRIVYSANVPELRQQQIPLRELNNGLYVLTVSSNKMVIYQSKLIKQD